MKIYTILENTSCRPELTPEHGLSLYIETDALKILFDMGKTTAFARNAELMGIDLKKVDIAFLSHGHDDHSGGMAEFLRINSRAKVYVSPYAFGDYCVGDGKFIGLDKALKDSCRHAVEVLKGC